MGLPNKKKGEFRPVYESLPDHPKFQALHPPARLLLYVLKTVLGAAGIKQLYVPVLADQTGLPEEVVEQAAQELEAVGWIRREHRIWWLVDGLEHEPNISLKNEKHRIFAAKSVASLPRLQIVIDFLEHYGLPDPDPGSVPDDPTPPLKGYGKGYRMGYGKGYTDPSPTPSPTPSPPRTQLQPTSTSPVDPGEAGVENSPGGEAEDEQLPVVEEPPPRRPLPRVTDAELKQVALHELGLGRFVRAPDQVRVNRELQALLQLLDRENLLAAIRGCAMLRDRGECGFEKGKPYTPGVLTRWGKVWYGEGDRRTERQLYDVAQDVYRTDGEKTRRDRGGLSRPDIDLGDGAAA